ncbi:MAG: hypothetical protein WD876_01620 [Candidatus Pacearchaeota archaeon]
MTENLENKSLDGKELNLRNFARTMFHPSGVRWLFQDMIEDLKKSEDTHYKKMKIWTTGVDIIKYTPWVVGVGKIIYSLAK